MLINPGTTMREILILGPGCAKCEKLFQNVQQAVNELNIECNIKKITDINQIISYGIMMTPGLVIDGKVVSSGRVINVQEIQEFLK